VIIGERPAQVIEVANNRVKIRTIRLDWEAEGHIRMHSIIPYKVQPSEKENLELWVKDMIGVKIGDFVFVGMSSKYFILGTAIIFGLPLIGLIAGVFLAKVICTFFHLLVNCIVLEIIFGILGMLLSLPFLRLFDKYVVKKPDFLPYVVRKVQD